MARPVHAVDEQDVLPAVGVVVEERAAGAQRLGQQLAAVRAAVVAELESGRGRDVGEREADACLREQIAAVADAATPAPTARRNSRRDRLDVADIATVSQGSVTRPLVIA